MSSKHYLVVGGSHGIGLELVKRLLGENCPVTVVSRTSDSLSTLDGVTHIELDVTRDELVPSSLPDSIAGFAYCPGSIQLGPFRGLDADSINEDFQLGVTSAVRCLQSALPAMKSNGKASAVFFSTVAVSQGLPMHASVAAVKGAVEGLTRSLAAELAPSIRVNCVAPSLTDTPLAERLLSSEKKRDAMASRHPLKRIGTVDDIAEAAHFLLSDRASWITGQVLHVDGGMSALRV